MIATADSMKNAQIRQRYLPDKGVWLFEAPMRLDPSAIEIARGSALKQMKDRLRSLPATAGVERRARLRAAINALIDGRIQQGIVGEFNDFPVFKANTRERPDRRFFIPREA